MVNGSLSTTDVSCDEFLISRIVYRNTALISPKFDYIEGHVVIYDEVSGVAVSEEWFTIRVHVENGVENQAPQFRYSVSKLVYLLPDPLPTFSLPISFPPHLSPSWFIYHYLLSSPPSSTHPVYHHLSLLCLSRNYHT